MADKYPTVLGGEHHQGGESEDLDKAYEHPPASRIANDAGKAHAYANGKVNGAGPGAGEKEGPDTTTAERGNTAGSGYSKGGPAPGIA